MIIEHIKEIYNRTESGKSWKKAPSKTIRENVDYNFYWNCIDSMKFFNSFGGGTCRGYKEYTYCGYMTTKIVRVSPDKTTKIVDYFNFTREV